MLLETSIYFPDSSIKFNFLDLSQEELNVIQSALIVYKTVSLPSTEENMQQRKLVMSIYSEIVGKLQNYSR